MTNDPAVRNRAESPAVARRRLRLALRKFRDDFGLTQADVARELQWSLSKVNRIETGEVTVSATDLDAMLDLFSIAGRDADRLADHCRVARRRGWWDRTDVRPHLTPALANLIQFQSDAIHIRAFGPVIFPGIIQFEDMARAILGDPTVVLSDSQRSVRLDLRKLLREQAIGAGSRANCTVVLDESVVLREFGGLPLLARQLRNLLEVIDQTRLNIRILPLATPTLFAIETPFMLVELDDGDTVLYREGMTDEFFDDRETVDKYRTIFDRQLAASLSYGASVKLIRARLAAIESALDRT